MHTKNKARPDLLFALAALISLTSESVSARPAPPTYQKELIATALSTENLREETEPEGKIIEEIRIIANDVVGERDIWPNFLNYFHATTRPEIIERELLFESGTPWNSNLIRESERNLRRYLFLSMARIVPVQGSTPDQVRALVVTKDLWSLRLNSEFSFVGSNLEELLLQFEERNVGGRMLNIASEFTLQLGHYEFGQFVKVPRVGGSRVDVNEKASLILNRETGELEGHRLSASLEQPLFSLSTPWGWKVAASHERDIYRLYSNAQLVEFTSDLTGETVPHLFRRDKLDLQLAIQRSLGRAFKQNFSFGWQAYSNRYSVPDPETSVQTLTLREFEDKYLPYSESAGMLFASYSAYVPNYQAFTDINSFALTEDFRMGPDFSADLLWANRIFGFDSNYLQPSLKLAWRTALGQNIVRGEIFGEIRHQPELNLSTPWLNRKFGFSFKNISPPLGPVRIHMAASLTRRSYDIHNSISVLGGESSLRGYPSNYLSGPQLFKGNLEARTLSFRIKSTHLGGVAFWDMGDAYDHPSELALHHSLGAGVRILFPEFNQSILRIDIGVPLENVPGGDAVTFVTKFGQAF